MFCRKCGREVQPGHKFCMSCGAKLEDMPAAASTPEKEEVPAVAVIPPHPIPVLPAVAAIPPHLIPALLPVLIPVPLPPTAEALPMPELPPAVTPAVPIR